MELKMRCQTINKFTLLAGLVILLTGAFSTLLFNWDFTNINGISKYSSVPHKPTQNDSAAFLDINWQNFLNQSLPVDFGNSTMVFNSIFAALKQSASDIHPLGLTYFPAMIAKGTLLYHTTPQNEIPESFEWLALDHEFSYFFGVKFPQYGRNGTGIPHGDKPKPKILGGNGLPKSKHGERYHFLTFEASRDLQLIYLDGASAAKTEAGEMDTQKLLNDVIESDMTEEEKKQAREKYHMEERLYADRICRWGKPLGLDGYVRVEIGFEVILCDFLNGSVDLISNITIPKPNTLLGIPEASNKTTENGWPIDPEGLLIEDKLTSDQIVILDQEDEWQRTLKQFSSMGGFDWIRVGNIHDKGESRVKLDYRYIVTGINRTEMDPNPNGRRLLNGSMNEKLQKDIVNELSTVIKNYHFGEARNIDWQLQIEQITDKFAPMIKIIQKILNDDTGKDMSPDEIALEVTRYTFNFILRFSNNDSSDLLALLQGRKLAIYQYVKPIGTILTENDLFIWSSIVNVVTEIVDKLFDIHTELFPIVQGQIKTIHEIKLFTEEEKSWKVMKTKKLINELVSQLHWITLEYECENKCQFDEICYTPSWGPSPLSWNSPFPKDNDTKNSNIGIRYDPNVGRNVIDNNLQCISVNLLLQK